MSEKTANQGHQENSIRTSKNRLENFKELQHVLKVYHFYYHYKEDTNLFYT